MKNFLISTIILLGLSVNISAQRHPSRPTAPPHPSKSQLYNTKASELEKKYNTERKLILNHPLLSKRMKRDQLQALNTRYQNEKRLLRSVR